MTSAHPFEDFLKYFIPEASKKRKLLYKALWLLETTGSPDAADLQSELEIENRLLYSDHKTYEQLLEWDNDVDLTSPLLKRQLKVLIHSFKQNIIPKNLLEEITKKEAVLLLSYANFRPELDGTPVSENDIREILKQENDPGKRQKAWEASKLIGDIQADKILELVNLRNKGAQSIGYSDYFAMQLDLQEVNEEWLFKTLDDLHIRSNNAYDKVLHTIEIRQSERFHVPVDKLGPWAWSEPFGQEDPLDSRELDSIVSDVDIIKACQDFYRDIGIDVKPVLDRSDMYERPGKNQHAFCINMDHGKDVRTLNNVKQTIKWLETVLHELGHAIYELGYDEKLPWLLKTPPHMITTEAMALFAGRQPYRSITLSRLTGKSEKDAPLLKKADESLQRRQLIFSRWVLVMTFFERELYRNPHQDLNNLWWKLVNKYQKISIPSGRSGKHDWAAKFHIGMAPVYYFSYLLGEMLASSIEECLIKEIGSKNLQGDNAGRFLQKKLFSPGSSLSWSDLIKHVTGQPLNGDAWIHQFAI